MQTYTYGDLLNIVGRQISRNIEDQYAPVVANMATNLIWHRFDWRESLAELPPFWLIPNEQDYGPPIFNVPEDFMALREAHFVDLQSQPPTRYEIDIIKDLRPTQVRSTPIAIGYAPSVQKFRLQHRAPENAGAPNYLIDGRYKKRPEKVTPVNLATTLLPFDDIYIQVWIEVTKWAAWSLSGDQRAANQLPIALEFIDQMARDEGVYLNDPTVSPREGLAEGFGMFPGGYGGRLIW